MRPISLTKNLFWFWARSNQLCTDTISDCKKIYADIFDDIVDEKQLVKPQSLSGAASMLALLLDTIDIDINEM